jgi:plasmid maintenance system antidote protein VapI
MEAYWADQLQTYISNPPIWGPRGYNIRECGTDSDEYINPQNMSNWWIGRKHKPESLEKIRLCKLGYTTSEETRKKQSASHMGLKPTPEAKEAARTNRIKSMIENGATGVKLTKENVIEVVNQHKSGLTQTEIAAHFNVQISVISRILSGKRWGYVTGIPETDCGTKKRGSPLGLESANQIRETYKAGRISYANLAKQYNVTKSTIANIVNGKLYPTV